MQRPDLVIDITHLPLTRIETRGNDLALGALVRMSDAARHPLLLERCPGVVAALLASASPQLRNLATLGGNLLQRTRCSYFRHRELPCNKRDPGSGCGAVHGENRLHAIFGGTEQCVATHASDLAVALLAAEARVCLQSQDGERSVSIDEFYATPRLPPQRDHLLAPGELITNQTLSDARSAPRIEAAAKVRGAARFPAEIPTPGLLHVALVGAMIPNGRVVHIDVARAQQVPGFIAVITHENATQLRPSEYSMALQDAQVHFVGQTVAAVIADSLLAARIAAAAISVTYESLPAVTSLMQGLEHSFAPKEAARVATDSLRGDPQSAFAASTVTLDAHYSTPANNHNPLEPHVVIATWQDEQLTVHTSTQAVFGTRRMIAYCFGLRREQVRVITQHIDGATQRAHPQ